MERQTRQTSRPRPPPIIRTTFADSRRVAQARPKNEGEGQGEGNGEAGKPPTIVQHLRPQRPAEGDSTPRPPKPPRQERPAPRRQDATSEHDDRLLILNEKTPAPDGSIYTEEKFEALLQFHMDLALHKSGTGFPRPEMPPIVQDLGKDDQKKILKQGAALRKEAKKSRKQAKKAAKPTASGADRRKSLLRNLTLPSKLPSLPKFGKAGLSAAGGGYEKLVDAPPPEKPQDPETASSTSSRSATDAPEKSG